MANVYLVRRKHVRFKDRTLTVGERFRFEDFPELEESKRERLAAKLVGLGRIEKVLEDPIPAKVVPKVLMDDDPKLEIEHVGGPWWRLPDGRKIMGKDKALNMLKAG